MTCTVTVSVPEGAKYFARVERNDNPQYDLVLKQVVEYLKPGETRQYAVHGLHCIHVSECIDILKSDVEYGLTDETGRTLY